MYIPVSIIILEDYKKEIVTGVLEACYNIRFFWIVNTFFSQRDNRCRRRTAFLKAFLLVNSTLHICPPTKMQVLKFQRQMAENIKQKPRFLTVQKKIRRITTFLQQVTAV